MNALDKFKKKVGLPAAFGEEQPYVRLAYVDESQSTGADADVEFDNGDDGGHVTVTVTEWSKDGTETVRNPEMRRVRFDLATGAVIGSNGDDINEALNELLIAVDGMRVLGDGA